MVPRLGETCLCFVFVALTSQRLSNEGVKVSIWHRFLPLLPKASSGQNSPTSQAMGTIMGARVRKSASEAGTGASPPPLRKAIHTEKVGFRSCSGLNNQLAQYLVHSAPSINICCLSRLKEYWGKWKWGDSEFFLCSGHFQWTVLLITQSAIFALFLVPQL